MHHFFGMMLNNPMKYLSRAELVALVRRAGLVALGPISDISDTLDIEASEYGAMLV